MWLLRMLGLAGGAAAIAAGSMNYGDMGAEVGVHGAAGDAAAREGAAMGGLPSNGGGVKGWWKRHAPSWLGGDGSLKDSNVAGFGKRLATFNEKAPAVMDQLMKDFNLTEEEAGVVLGNLGHESAGFRAFNEGGGGPGRGWAQWTEPGRKRRFFEYARVNGLDPKSDEANYGFLKWELNNTHRNAIAALKNGRTAEEKMYGFEHDFEGARVKAYGSRFRYMHAAIAAHHRKTSVDVGMPTIQSPISPDAVRNALPPGGLAAPPSWNRAYHVTHNHHYSPNHKVQIAVNGAGNPAEVGRHVAYHQARINGDLVRNLKGAVT
jgi:hypothetical protein